ncbi:tRNA CCA-pyrophosphorylase [Advenella kashmirensis W13003]|uniref:tRNA CCA-pyrophosphorylase n=1 Tax=Advenella kashmirensis W13003 TaxID=1424334 RepID=V8QVT6_9BURK|nr:tRNA CCA-pyrophosphorylase [Advenella kashmirensis]ETF03104.1 tRNA CCA-pyrophosphorylase [Advenella kashmirensis W13003]
MAATDGLDVYVVGGAVRDELLGLPQGDRDWVVVGASPQEMIRRGFVPVGGDFPVFLHPQTKEEYALARTERKAGRGYKGFTFHTGTDVTLEEDLKRRDLTINAMARRPDGTLVDPLRGRDDLERRVFRHASDAFVEDPVRILRLARFAARFTDFTLAGDTLALCRDMVRNGEVDALVPERVWKEVSRGLMSEKPSRMFSILHETTALPVILPQLQWNNEVAQATDLSAARILPLAARYAALLSQTPGHAALSRHLKVPADCADYARLTQVLSDRFDMLPLPPSASAQAHLLRRAAYVQETLEATDSLRKPARFRGLLEVVLCTRHSVAENLDAEISRIEAWTQILDCYLQVDAAAVARQAGTAAQDIKTAVRKARLDAIVACLEQMPER